MARTDIYAVAGLDAAIERCQLYLEAGVDFAKPQGVDELPEIERVIAEVPGPHIGTLSQAAGAAKVTIGGARARWWAAVTFPSVTLFAAVQAVRSVLRGIKSSNSLDAITSELVPLKDYYDLVGLERDA